MGNQIDLHMHSNKSNDGEYSPEELMNLCKEHGLTFVALADHNSVKGILQAKEKAKELGIAFLAGIELDCEYKGYNLHVLGYGIDDTLSEWNKYEKELLIQEQEASKIRLERIRSLGIYVNEDKVMQLAVERVITGEMIAEVALADKRNDENPILLPYREHGLRSENPYVNFYWDLCSQGKPAYVPIQYMSLSDAIFLIRKAGGVPVLAHPGINIGKDINLLKGIIECGIEGIEVYSSYHDKDTISFYRQKAKEYALFQTLGSDFHGKIKPAICLGEMECEDEEEITQKFRRIHEMIETKKGDI